MNMLFTHEIHHLGGETFEVDVDDQTLTWTSKPPGKSIPRPITLHFTHGGRRGAGRSFTILPDGRAEARPMIGDDF